MTMTAEEGGTTFQRGLSEWWSEETEYVFQRIERWAAFARGYNRLRSQRLSRGRMTMQGSQEPRWSISANKLIIDDSSWSPRFHNLKRSRRKSRPEEAKINCCGTFNYQSNNNLDSSCLEPYRYDHSIYFKTIGDIRNGKKEFGDNENDRDEGVSISSEELVEWDLTEVSDLVANRPLEENIGYDLDNRRDYPSDNSAQGIDTDRTNSTASWPIVDLAKLDLNLSDSVAFTDERIDRDDLTAAALEENNNYITDEGPEEQLGEINRTRANPSADAYKGDRRNEQGFGRFVSFRKTSKLSATAKQPPINDDSRIVWPRFC